MLPDQNPLKKKAEAILNADPDQSDHLVAIFDEELNYLYANASANGLLKISSGTLEGKNLLALFPQLTASRAHRHLLSALGGEALMNAPSEGIITKEGAQFSSDYHPVFNDGKVEAVIAVTRKVYFP